MTEVPEHLLRRAKERREALGSSGGDEGGEAAAPQGADEAASYAEAEKTGKIPAHLLERSRAARAKAGGGEAPASEGAATPAAGAVATAPPPPPTVAGPGGHTQRLLTVVKAGSIQDVKAKPVDKVHTWPHLLVVEFVAALAITAFLLIFSIFVDAPLLSLANANETPNPSKAPWYFMGLQELLTMFHPMVAGVTIPGMGIFALILAPYTDRNPSNKPEDRKFAISLFSVHLMFWAILTIIGSFFRGPGFNFVFPWIDGIFFHL